MRGSVPGAEGAAPGAPRVRGTQYREGIALVVVILLLVALALTGHGALVLARGESASARSLRRAGLARMTTSWAARAVSARLVGDTLPALPRGARQTLATGSWGVSELTRLSGEFFLLTARPAVEVRAGVSSANRLLWALDPFTRVASTAAVLRSGAPAATAGTVEGRDFFRVSDGDGPSCAAWTARLDSLAASRPAPLAVGALVTVAGDLRSGTGPALRLGLLGPDSLAARLRAFPPGSATPAPRTGSTSCLDAPGNWGAPSDPLGPCGRRRVAIAVPGALTLVGGEGQGLLAVWGDLTLRGGARLAGIVLVGGDLDVGEGSSIRGVVRVEGSAAVRAGSRIDGAACPALAALSAAVPLRRPVALPDPLLGGL